MTNTSEVLSELQKALQSAERAHTALEKAKSSLQPLEMAATEADNAVKVLVRQYESAIGDAPRKRGGSPGPRKSYNITAEGKVAATIKRQTTRALNSGKSEAESKKIGAAAGKALAAKLGLK